MASPFLPVSETAMSDTLTRHSRSEDYTFRIPTPPRIVIPPLVSWNHEPQLWHLGEIISHPDPTINIDFLKNTNYTSTLLAKNLTGGWRYDNRRSAQSILSFLYLGPLHAAKDRDFLQREEITMLLGISIKSGVGAALTMGAIRVANELNLTNATLEVATPHELITIFPKATTLINTHLRELHNRATLNPAGGIRSGKVLIFCESGNEKSAAVTVAYLMENFDDVDYIKACQICNTRRFCCSFDDHMKQMLRTYDDILNARRGVAMASGVITPNGHVQPVTSPFFGAPAMQHPQPQAAQVQSFTLLSNTSGRAKRGRETDEDEMDVDEAEMDVDRFTNRAMAPFR